MVGSPKIGDTLTLTLSHAQNQVAVGIALTLLPATGWAETPGETLNYQANDLAAAGRFKDAIPLYTKAIAIEPAYVEPYYNRGKAELSLDDYAAALADFNVALRLTPDNGDIYNNRGITKKMMGDLSGAIADYNTALKFSPTLYRVYLNRGIAQYANGNEPAACADLKLAAEHQVAGGADGVSQLGCK